LVGTNRCFGVAPASRGFVWASRPNISPPVSDHRPSFFLKRPQAAPSGPPLGRDGMLPSLTFRRFRAPHFEFRTQRRGKSTTYASWCHRAERSAESRMRDFASPDLVGHRCVDALTPRPHKNPLAEFTRVYLSRPSIPTRLNPPNHTRLCFRPKKCEIIRFFPTFSDTPNRLWSANPDHNSPDQFSSPFLRGEKNLSGPRRSQADLCGPKRSDALGRSAGLRPGGLCCSPLTAYCLLLTVRLNCQRTHLRVKRRKNPKSNGPFLLSPTNAEGSIRRAFSLSILKIIIFA
jgi:hypothetical protein